MSAFMPVIHSRFSVCRLFRPSCRSAFTGYFFVLPAAGLRNHTEGVSTNQARNGYYWASPLNASGQSTCLNMYSDNATVSDANLAYGLSVRCVQAFTATLLILYFQKLITLHYR